MNSKRNEIGSSGGRRKILVLGKGGLFSEETADYAVHLAERLDYDLLAVSVGQIVDGDRFVRTAQASFDRFKLRASKSGIGCDHMVKYGDLGAAVEELVHEVRRIEFVVTDSEVSPDEVVKEVTVPMFSVISNSLQQKGEKEMAKQNVIKKKPMGATIGYGLLTVALYAAVFTNADTVMHYFTKGGWYAALPVATVFLFSFAHGSFASNLWSLLGVEAMKKETLRQAEQKVVEQRKKAAKKPRAYAYINPFHRI